jgi:hypothetical protein
VSASWFNAISEATPVFVYDTAVETFVTATSYEPSETYYLQVNTFETYEPSAPVWTDYNEPSNEDLYFFEESSATYSPVETANPYVSYYTYSLET